MGLASGAMVEPPLSHRIPVSGLLQISLRFDVRPSVLGRAGRAETRPYRIAEAEARRDIDRGLLHVERDDIGALALKDEQIACFQRGHERAVPHARVGLE